MTETLSALETIIDRFGEDIFPFADEMVKALVEMYSKYLIIEAAFIEPPPKPDLIGIFLFTLIMYF